MLDVLAVVEADSWEEHWMSDDGRNPKKPGVPFNVLARRPRQGSPLSRGDVTGMVEAMTRSNPQLMALARQAMERDRATFDAQQASGAGLLADEVLRYFQRDYENRGRLAGPRGMPTSHQIGGSFFNQRYTGSVYLLWPERDYLVSFSDFLDFVTAGDSPKVDLGLGYTLTEGVIYNVTASDDASDLLLATQGDAAFGFRAASMLRTGDDLVMLVSVAEQLSPSAIEHLARVAGSRITNVAPEKVELIQHLQERGSDEFGPGRVVRIEDTDLLPTTAMIRFNLKKRSVEGRCLLRDLGDRFDTLTDVHAALAVPGLSEASPEFLNMVASLDESDALWEVANALTLLPAYLDARITMIQAETRETRLGKLPAAKRKELAQVDESQRMRYRTISAVRVERTFSAPGMSGRSFTPPQFQIPVDGFWRELAGPEQVGKDAEGLPVNGRTWVRAHVRYKDRPVPTDIKTVYIKASLSVARQRLEAYRRRMSRKDDVPVPAQVESVLPAALVAPPAEEGLHGAYVYVMRCHAHTENLFKVGFTDRDPEVRAKELSASTSAPSPFVVLRAWAVADGRAAEQAAHAALSAVRLSTNREFFHTPYAELQTLLDAAVQPWVLEA
ncbi:GIY-YIG nuclease family protein [Paraburkholderia aspalathi]|nr:GIY-YIG nuclease family protein [Paraburkholderia aspalathi]MBK3780423.1 GIY-YIG nuclease family protein [Paraburkholderia aspalathi]